MTRKVLITGAAGFIGSHLAQALTHMPEPPDLTLVDNLQRGDLATIMEAAATGSFRFLRIDLTDPTAYEQLDRDFDEVYHLAAVNGTKTFYADPANVLRTNVLSLINILDWIRTWPDKRPRFLFTSSNEAYAGALSAFSRLPIPTPEDVPLVIEDPYNARWSYAGSKLVGEQFVIHYARRYDIPSIIVRPHNFYGPRAGSAHVIPEMLARIRERETPFMIRGHSETRSFCYITDAVDAMIRLMEHTTVAAQTVHVGSESETRISKLATMLFEICDWFPPHMDYQPSLQGSVARRLPSVELVRLMTGWRATTDLRAGLALTAAWYRDRHDAAER